MSEKLSKEFIQALIKNGWKIDKNGNVYIEEKNFFGDDSSKEKAVKKTTTKKK